MLETILLWWPLKCDVSFNNRVAKPAQVYFGGNVIGESAMKSEEEIGSLIEYEFRVSWYIYMKE